MNELKRIFLDLDGPLLDGKEKHYHCYRSIMEKFSFKPIGIDEYWENKRALVNRRDLLSLSGAEEIYDIFCAAWLSMIESPDVLVLDKLQEGAVDCLRSWKTQGIKLTLVTMRKNKQALEQQLNSMGLRNYFDAVLVCSHDEGGEGKANAVQKMYYSEQSGKHFLWIGDTEVDLEAANLLGCPVILLSNGLRNEKFLEILGGEMIMPSIAHLKNNVLKMLNAY